MGKDILDILLDEENLDPIVLTDENGCDIAFDQVAVIAHDGKLYCILKPIEHIDYVDDDEVIIFYVADKNEDGNSVLRIELDDCKAAEVFKKYCELLDDED